MITKNDQFNPFYPIILIGWENQNHYELLLPKTLNENELPIEIHYNEQEDLSSYTNNIFNIS